jgi:TonB family protein
MRCLCCLSAALLGTIAWAQQEPPSAPTTWRVAKRNFIAPLGASPPKLVKWQYSSSLQAGSNHAVSVSFQISDKGVPFDVQVENSSDTESTDEVIAMIREWRFEAAMKDGLPVSSGGYLDLLMGQEPAQPPDGKPRRRK